MGLVGLMVRFPSPEVKCTVAMVSMPTLLACGIHLCVCLVISFERDDVSGGR